MNAPYFRIARFTKYFGFTDYLCDDRYAHDRTHRIAVYHSLEKDLKELFLYIDPSDKNKECFSVKIFELLLRAATEFESNCKAILTANDYKFPSHPSMDDYKKIEVATKLSKYQIKLATWDPPLIIEPLTDWNNDCNNSKSLKWYQNYNKVKHDRCKNFSLANLDNAIKAVASVFTILFSQFGYQTFDPHQETSGFSVDSKEFYYGYQNLFSIRPYMGWEDKDIYDPHLDPDKREFRKYDFK